MKNTNIFQKIFPSIINALIIFIISPLLLVHTDKYVDRKYIYIGLFFICCMFFQIFNKNQDLGMFLAGTKWKKDYPFKNQLIYNILYTLSFATLFFRVHFFLDVFLVNMLMIQLPFVLVTGTTAHGYFAGKMVTVREG